MSGHCRFRKLQRSRKITLSLVTVLAVSVLLSGLPRAGSQGVNAGDLDGQVVDGSNSNHPAIVGASVCFIYTVGACQATNSTGGFLFRDVPAGTLTISVTASGFNPSPPITVNVGTGGLYHAGQIGLQAASPPWYQSGILLISALVGLLIEMSVIAFLAHKVAAYKRFPKDVGFPSTLKEATT